MSTDTRLAEPPVFSVVLGGPLFKLYRRAHLSGEALELTTRRAITLSLVAWVPLLLLSMLGGHAWRGVNEPFILDIDVHARLLVALPLLVGAELFVHRRAMLAVRMLLERGLVTDAGRPQFEATVASTIRLRDSTLVELALVAFVYCVGIGVIWRHLSELDTSTWYRLSNGPARHTTLAGWWYVLVSLPLFQFILYRWYFRIGLWAWFLWRVARTQLHLIPTHPDQCGGLGFLDEVTLALAPLLSAHGVLSAGIAASGILFEGKTLVQYGPELALLLVLVCLIAFGPLLVFAPTLSRCRRIGLDEYGLLAQRYVEAFDRKWIGGGHSLDDRLLGTPDLQSLADLSHSYQIVKGVHFVPIDHEVVLRLAAAALAPMLPLLFSLVSPRELLQVLLKGLV